MWVRIYTLSLIPTRHGTSGGMPHMSWLGLWHHVRGRVIMLGVLAHVMTRAVACVTCFDLACGTMLGVVVGITCLGSARGTMVRGRITHHGRGRGMPHDSFPIGVSADSCPLNGP